ncbi:MAG: cobamide remodeling phosphodiesterase CbiR, partial [Fibrobacter sp.]|nr:cobamide remodeling phosphodiesterase CbiR [Fibrobacter sp.]
MVSESEMLSKSKGAYPFFCGTSSYIIPDNIIPNVRMLASYVDDVELVLFESPEYSNIPSSDDIRELIDIQTQESIGYTVHLPTDRKAGAVDMSERIGFCDDVKRVIELSYPLNPRAWILHLEGIRGNVSNDERKRWEENCCWVLEKISGFTDRKSSIAVENLGYTWSWHKDLVDQFNMSLCCDIGHLWLYYKDSWLDDFKAMLTKTIVIHLHGVCNNKDHVGL